MRTVLFRYDSLLLLLLLLLIGTSKIKTRMLQLDLIHPDHKSLQIKLLPLVQRRHHSRVAARPAVWL